MYTFFPLSRKECALFMVKAGTLQTTLTAVNPWWRSPHGWEQTDVDLASASSRSLVYEPEPLADIVPGGLYVLRGPRRVGKSLELKRVVSRLVHLGVNPRHIIHYPCDRLTASDLEALFDAGRTMSGVGTEPRWWLLDEISSITDGWPSVMKWLRDNTALKNDCVVVTGSSSRDLLEAQKELAGRRNVSQSDRYLMPMSFRSFAKSVSPTLRQAPPVTVPASKLGDRRLMSDAVYELIPFLHELVPAWEQYLQVGGYPAAVNDWMEQGQVGSVFITALWDVIHGDAFRSAGISPAQTQGLLEELSRKIANPLGDLPLAREVGLHDAAGKPDGEQAKARLMDLQVAFVAWRCHQRREEQFLPKLRAWAKVYFSDPLLARLAHLRNQACTDPGPTLLTEQQIGRALVLAHEVEVSGAILDFSHVMYVQTPSRSEIDFVGSASPEVGIESKYVDHGLVRASQTLRAQIAAGDIASGLLATRSVVDVDPTKSCWAIPASLLAWMLPTPWDRYTV